MSFRDDPQLAGLGVHDMSADGRTLVGSRGGTPLYWPVGQELVELPLPPGAAFASIYVVSGDGSVMVGLVNFDPSGWGTVLEPYVWDLQGGVTWMGRPDDTTVSPFDISDDGSVVVGYTNGANGYRGFAWTQEMGLVDITDFTGLSGQTAATAITPDGSTIVGTAGITDESGVGFRWSQADGITWIGDPDSCDEAVVPLLVSADGEVAVGLLSHVEPDSSVPPKTFRWTESGGVKRLIDDPAISESRPFAISADGQLIAGWTRSSVDNTPSAFIWDPVNGLQDLNVVLVDQYGLDLRGWHLGDVTGMSADGMTMVGNAFDGDGGAAPYIVHVPEPSVLLLLSVAALILKRRAQ
jgi:uncharacterized membrane protein